MHSSWDTVRNRRMDGRTGGRKKWHIEVGAPPKKWEKRWVLHQCKCIWNPRRKVNFLPERFVARRVCYCNHGAPKGIEFTSARIAYWEISWQSSRKDIRSEKILQVKIKLATLDQKLRTRSNLPTNVAEKILM